MKKLFIIAIAFALSSCAINKPDIRPIKGDYPIYPVERLYNFSADDVWSNVIDFFATNGLSIKIIDKQSGLILSEKVSFMQNGSYERLDGPGINKPQAFVVIERKAVSPNSITGEWNIRVKSMGGKTHVRVNIVQLRAEYLSNSYLVGNEVFDVRSTGVFERMILDGIEGK